MDKHKKILLISTLLILVFFLLSACKASNGKKEEVFLDNINFPTKDNTYPDPEFVLINGKQYQLKNFTNTLDSKGIDYEIQLKSEELADEVSVVLSRVMPISIWTMDENINNHLVSYFSIESPIKEENILEGQSNLLQKFDIQLSKENSQEIKFKWSNINELGKSFEDKDENYLLTINILN